MATKLNPARAALGQMLKLVEDGILVRNIKDDGDVNKYLEQSVRLAMVLKQAQEALAPTDATKTHAQFDDGTRHSERKPALDE